MEGTQSASETIVICGMSARLPGSDNVEEFWEHLINGENMVSPGGIRWKQGISVVHISYFYEYSPIAAVVGNFLNDRCYDQVDYGCGI